ncbi:hypothetical protein I553_0223 [Mycobacterium xenopi 4042]|uniref:Uncharacterized protein n=1 Tax=Mycobacterium xenopi 4042 TaxID=1299334 RepID=X7YLJ1_MYCXE|nr:hypothetical protein I553_0223 [Mycobacterium xenopi 4042]
MAPLAVDPGHLTARDLRLPRSAKAGVGDLDLDRDAIGMRRHGR